MLRGRRRLIVRCLRRPRSVTGRDRATDRFKRNVRNDHRRNTGEQYQGPRTGERGGRQGRSERGGGRSWRFHPRALVRHGLQRRGQQRGDGVASTPAVSHDTSNGTLCAAEGGRPAAPRWRERRWPPRVKCPGRTTRTTSFLRRWLANGPRGSSAWHPAQGPVIAIYPKPMLGRRIWLPPGGEQLLPWQNPDRNSAASA